MNTTINRLAVAAHLQTTPLAKSGFDPQPEPPKLYPSLIAQPSLSIGHLSKGTWVGFNPQPEPPADRAGIIIDYHLA